VNVSHETQRLQSLLFRISYQTIYIYIYIYYYIYTDTCLQRGVARALRVTRSLRRITGLQRPLGLFSSPQPPARSRRQHDVRVALEPEIGLSVDDVTGGGGWRGDRVQVGFFFCQCDWGRQGQRDK